MLGENPHPSLAWETEEIQEAFHGCAEAVADQCRYGLVHPVNKVPLRKRTRFMGNEEVVAPLRLKCDGSHEHWPIEGKFKDESGRWQALSEWAGGYPIALCNAIMDGAENFMRNQPNVLVEDLGEEGVMSEGDMIDGDDAVREEEQVLDERMKKTCSRKWMTTRDIPFHEKCRRPWNFPIANWAIRPEVHWLECSR